MKIPDWLLGLMSSSGCGNKYAICVDYIRGFGFGCGIDDYGEYGHNAGEGWGDEFYRHSVPSCIEITQLELLLLLMENADT